MRYMSYDAVRENRACQSIAQEETLDGVMPVEVYEEVVGILAAGDRKAFEAYMRAFAKRQRTIIATRIRLRRGSLG